MEEIIKNLKDTLYKVAPSIVELSLNEGATDTEIEKLEQCVNKKLPDDLKALYKAINGNVQDENLGNFFYGMEFYPIEKVISNWEFRKKQSGTFAVKQFHSQIDGSDFFNPDWLQIGSDGSRCGLYVDLAPAVSGTYGQIVYLEGTYLIAIVVSKSTEELLLQFTKDLDNGLYYLAEDALEDGNHWLETEDSIELYKVALKINE